MTQNKKELVSVIIRTLNEEKYLPELLEFYKKAIFG
jgi:glycosyltransferase involved in cell wall biosynthesis